MNKRHSFWGLSPLLFFVAVYLGYSVVLDDFYKVPILPILVVSALMGLAIYRRIKVDQKVEAFCKGAGDGNIMLMCLIFLLAGAFGQVSKEIGAVQSAVNLGLSYLSPSMFIVGMFVIACVVSISMGTSVGTIAALTPIAVGVGETVANSLPLVLGAIVGGAMFGDNLSFISDTTIVATRTQGVAMRDKFKTNFKVVIVPALLTIVLYGWMGSNLSFVGASDQHPYHLIDLVPYLGVFVLAFVGIHVIWTLAVGVAASVAIGVWQGSASLGVAVKAINTGMAGMFELCMVCLLIGGIVGLITLFGGIEYLLHHTARRINSRKQAELGIATLTGIVNACIANNTITILIVGPLARKIADRHHVDPKQSATLLDTVSCFVQGILPYGAQILVAISIVGGTVSSFQVIAHLYYPFLTGISMLLFVLVRPK